VTIRSEEAISIFYLLFEGAYNRSAGRYMNMSRVCYHKPEVFHSVQLQASRVPSLNALDPTVIRYAPLSSDTKQAGH
jgi:hypothetical protein